MSGLRRLVRHPIRACGDAAGFVGACLVALLVVVVIGAPVIAPHDPFQVRMADQLIEPGAAYWLGTDQAGRDVLSRVVWGARASLQVAVFAVVIGVVGGVSLGLFASFCRGSWAEQLIMRLLEALSAIPILLWAIALVGLMGVKPIQLGPLTIGNETKLLMMLGLLYIPTLARLTYMSAIVEAQANYVAARRLQGVGAFRILVSDVLPNCLSPVIVQATLLLAIGIIIEAAVSFVGLGVQPPVPSWGNMLADARNYLMSGEWWLSVFPGAAISLSVIGFNLLGDGLRDRLDPRHSTAGVAS
jgi:peptide/nickel transport system permease protein